MPLCGKKPPKIHELKFMNLCTEGCYKREAALDALWNVAVADNCQRQILDAKDQDGDTPLQKCSSFGNPTVLEWVIKKWKEEQQPLDFEKKDSEGNTPIMAACMKGYLGSEAIAGKLFSTKKKRLETITILVKHGADVNVQSDIIKMTPLHWAAYNDDPGVIAYLLNKGAKLQFSRKSNGDGTDATPVDIAGVCNNEDIVYVFAKWNEERLARYALQRENDPNFVEDGDTLQKATLPGSSQVLPLSKIVQGFQSNIQTNINSSLGAIKSATDKLLGKGVMNGKALRSKFETDPKTGKTIVELAAVRRSQLTESHRAELRIYYWAAYYGRTRSVNCMIMQRRWSPFIKSFHNQTVLVAAVRGQRLAIVQRLVGSFEYKAQEGDIGAIEKLVNGLTNADISDNNLLHYSYLTDVPEIREVLKQNKLISADQNGRNIRGRLPKELRHAKKVEDSDDEDYLMESVIPSQTESLRKRADNTDRVLAMHSGLFNDDESNLDTTKILSDKQRLAFFRDPDYTFVTTNDMLPILKMELDSLLRDGGVYFSVFETNSDTDKRVVVLYFDDSLIDMMAEIQGVKARLSNYPVLTEFKCFASDLFEQFNSRQVHSIIQNTLSDHCDIEYMVKSHVIQEHFPCHTEDRKVVWESWKKFRFKLVWGFIWKGFEANMQPLNFISDYYGEKYGFYFAWLVHYTGQLILPSLIGIAILAWQTSEMFINDLSPSKAFNTHHNFWYAIFLMFWSTWLVESWKRKQAVIGHKWLMRDYNDTTSQRYDFKAALDVDVQTKKKWMVSVVHTYLHQILIGIPVSMFFIALVILVQVVRTYWKESLENEYGDQASIPMHFKFMPSIFNTFFIGLFGLIYKKVALWLVVNENHRQNFDYENSLINKIYMFQFINAYISNYIYAFYNRDFTKVQTNLVTIIIGIQVGNNVVEFCIDRFYTQRKIDKIAASYKEDVAAVRSKIAPTDDTPIGKSTWGKIKPEAMKADANAYPGQQELVNKCIDAQNAQGDLLPLKGPNQDKQNAALARIELKQFCEEQLVMKLEKGEQFVWYYNEAFTQLGFIAFFAYVFPAAPVFSFITNFLEIRIKLQSMSKYSKRTIAEGAKGIGSWLAIMELISIISIPINIAMVFVLGYREEDSVLIQKLENSDLDKPVDEQIWSNANILILLIFLEHAILALKMIFAIIIPDVPEYVLFEEFRHEQIATMAKKEMQVFKLQNGHENYDDMLSRLKKDTANLKDKFGKPLKRGELASALDGLAHEAMLVQRDKQRQMQIEKIERRKAQARKKEKARMDTSSDSESEDQYDLLGIRAAAEEGLTIDGPVEVSPSGDKKIASLDEKQHTEGEEIDGMFGTTEKGATKTID